MDRDDEAISATSAEIQDTTEELRQTPDHDLPGRFETLPSIGYHKPSPVLNPPPSGPRWTSPAPAGRNRGFSLRRAALAINFARSDANDNLSASQHEKLPVQEEITEGSGGKHGSANEEILISSSDQGTISGDDKTAAPECVVRSQGLWSQRRTYSASIKTNVTKVFRTITRTNPIPRSKDGRHIDLNPTSRTESIDERTGNPYISNTITSSRYNIFNFLPRQLVFQFSRVSNFYFLCIAVLQLTGFSTTGTYSTLVPLMAFVSIAMAKEGFDDYRRHLLDKVENEDTVDILICAGAVEKDEEAGSNRTWTETKWSAVKVGNVVRLKRDTPIPADLVLIYSDGPSGMAYIDTAALDGESNLKAKQASPILRKACSNEHEVATCQAHVVVEDPNIDLYNFNGRITRLDETLPLTGSEVVYRGSVLRNTSNAYGLVINTGEECKIRMNAMKNSKAKAPSMQRIVNQIVVIIACFVLILTGLNVAAYGVWKTKQENHFWYLMGASVGKGELLASTFVMFSTMIPLALYISMEIVKVGQMYFLAGDREMFDEETNTPMEPRTNTINEELGQISHVFSDKTGTLTENIMRFRKMSVAGTAWLHAFDLKKVKTTEQDPVKEAEEEVQAGKESSGHVRQLSVLGALPTSSYALERTESDVMGRRSTHMSRSGTEPRPSISLYEQPSKSKAEPTTEDLVAYLQRKADGPFTRKARFLLLAMALCHTALPETQEDGSINYQAMSPDETALVRAAKDLGVIVVDRPSQSITIVTRLSDHPLIETRETYEVLDVVEFSSKRKRMSIIIRFPDGKICLFTKGADSTIIKRLKIATGAVQKDDEIRRSLTAKRLSESQDELRRQSDDRPRNSLSRPSLARSRSRLGRPSLIRNRSSVDGRSSIDILGRVLHNSPRPSMALSRKSSNFGNLMIDHSIAADDSATLVATLRHIHDFASEGLRTLMYGYRWLEENEYQTWKKRFHAASTSLVNRQELIDQTSESLEQELELAGATAIEDELQKGVPETIDKLRRAGMRVWMLTGDKRETAINIGHSCKLITSFSEVTILDHEKNNVEEAITSSLQDIRRGEVAHSVVVVDGQTLSDIEGNPALAALFFKLVIAANSVICCRASPTQKAFLVKTVRTKVKGSVTLAIGDSANDIAMIQEAHVGIGISGKEGMQAARTSDYSIGQFRFLQRLLLVHGRWNYIRTGKYILGTFWKEMMFFLTQAIYQGYNGFTGTSLYEWWSGSVINVIFCALCIIFLGIFEQDLQASTLLAVPELYRSGQRNGAFNLKLYAWWNFMALTDAVLIYYFVHLSYGLAQFNDVFVDSSDIFAYGQLAFAICVVVINTKLMYLVMHNRTLISFIGWFCGIGGWWLWNLIINQVYDPSTSFYGVKHGFVDRFGRSSLWWLTLIVTSAAVMLWEVAVEAVRIAWWPDEVDVFQELEGEKSWRRRFESVARGEGRWDDEEEEEE